MKELNRFKTLPWLAAAVLIPSSALAGDYTWDGDTSGSWSIGTNWVGNPGGAGAPTMGIGSTQTFYNTGAANLATFLGSGRIVGILNFNAIADSDVTVRFASLATAGAARDLTFDVTTGNAAINIDSNAAGSFTLGGSDGLGSILLNDSLVVTHNGSGILLINRPISDGSTPSGVAKNGASALTLSNINNFTGGLVLNAGTLNINNLYALGGTTVTPGTVTINGGTIDNTSAAAIILSAKPNPFSFNGDFAFGGTKNLNLGAGAVSLGTAAGTSRTITTNAGILTLEGVISDGTTANSLIKSGAGTLSLANVNAYTGATVIKAGTLKINTTTTLASSSSIVTGDAGSSGAVLDVRVAGLTVGNTQTLAGLGKVLATGKIVTASGTISAGDSGVGTLSLDGGTLSLDATSKLTYALGTSSDLVSLLNSATLNLGSGTLGLADFTFTDSGGFAAGAYTLIGGASSVTGFLDGSDLTGVVNGLSSTLSMSGNNLILTAIPEPNAALLVGGVGLLISLRRRRR